MDKVILCEFNFLLVKKKMYQNACCITMFIMSVKQNIPGIRAMDRVVYCAWTLAMLGCQDSEMEACCMMSAQHWNGISLNSSTRTWKLHEEFVQTVLQQISVSGSYVVLQEPKINAALRETKECPVLIYKLSLIAVDFLTA